MGLQELICAGRPGIDEKDESDYQPLVGSSMSVVAQSEKKVAVDNDDEDEMQGRLSDLRGAINDAKVDWYVVPSEDEHQSEFVGASDQRREYISGFTGSAGTAVIPSSSQDADALLFVDSRYWIQAEKQVPKVGWKVVRVGSSGGSGSVSVEKGWTDWLLNGAEEGSRIGIDPKLISLGMAKSLESRLKDESSSTRLIPLTDNLVDKIHTTTPRPDSPLYDYPIELAGKATVCKLQDLRDALSAKVRGQEWVYIIPALPSIAWLLNYRCDGDVDGCPVAYAYAVVTVDECILFVDKKKVEDEALRQRLEDDGVEIRPYGVDEIGKYISQVSSGWTKDGGQSLKVWAPKECSWAIQQACNSSSSSLVQPDSGRISTKSFDIDIIPCPIEEAKAIKNEVEIQGIRNAYLRDGRATVRFLSFMNDKLVKEKRPVGEWAAGQMLTRFRRQEENFKMPAGEISASGPNAASPHYEPKRGEDSLIDIDAPYLFDTGAQYLDGTIDTTRTVFFGKNPSDEVKRAYTRVLQAHIAIATSVFPEGTSADWLNMLAKQPLWEDGLDFQHGLGHGVGCFLSVHEHPLSFPHGYAYKPGVVTTVEPGYYKEGEFGVRTESLFVCKEVEKENKADDRRWLGWDRLTQVPIQTSLVDWSIMWKREIQWLNDHNTSVQEAVMPLLTEDQDAAARDWLKNACKPKKIWPWTGRKE